MRRAAIRRVWACLPPLAFAHRVTVARRVRVVAVVGSSGKTTTARAVAAVLGCDDKHWMPPHAVLKLRPWQRHGVMEVGIDAPGQMVRYARVVRPQIVVVTSIGSDHRNHLKSVEGTRQEKAEMVRALAPAGLAVLNGDDANVRWIATQTVAGSRTFGFGAGNDVRAIDAALDWPHGTRFTLQVDGDTREVRVRLIGRHMLYPVLAAVTVGLAEGLDLDAVLERLAKLPPGSNRVQPMSLPNGAILLRDQCKASIENVDAALDVLAELPASRKIVVLGDVNAPPMGTLEEVEAMYARLGGRVAGIAGRAVFVNVNVGERGRRPYYTPGALAAGLPPAAIFETSSVLEAAESVAADLRPGDVVLLEAGSQQHFDRIALALGGRTVRCDLEVCTAWLSCGSCPMLGRTK